MSKNWIAGAIKHPGALRKSLGVKGDKPIPAKKLAKAAKKGGKLGARARLAQTLKGMHHGEDEGLSEGMQMGPSGFGLSHGMEDGPHPEHEYKGSK
jgi:hypothetical protein